MLLGPTRGADLWVGGWDPGRCRAGPAPFPGRPLAAALRGGAVGGGRRPPRPAELGAVPPAGPVGASETPDGPPQPSLEAAPHRPRSHPAMDGTAMADNNLKRCQEAADEVQVIMLDNFNKVIEREGKLSDLDERAKELRNQSSAFCKTTKTVARQELWRNRKWKIILGVVIATIVLLLLGILLYFVIPESGNQEASSKTSADGN